jgi:acetyl esterase/lipase
MPQWISNLVVNYFLPPKLLNNANRTPELDNQKSPGLPKPRLTLAQIATSLPKNPVTNHGASASDETNLGWLRPGDPRSELLLTIFHSDIGLPLMLHGLPSSSSLSSFPRPSNDLVVSISPLARVRSGGYAVPTFIVHGTKDVIAPYPAAERFTQALRDRGVESKLLGLEGLPHVFDVRMRPGSEGWENCVRPGLDFLVEHARA